ncbi:MAG TPA: SDR family NAD(P)-dependent oxidoreductase, partial [Thermosynergistes sp.]|nr:SDR family NAD(P)-dependent oxidoreductase [Thermosynergistes sp.]
MPSKDYRGLFDLTDKVAAVTGGAGGLGREAVLALGQHGCHVAVVDLDTSKVRHLESAFSAMGRNISFIDADITRSD